MTVIRQFGHLLWPVWTMGFLDVLCPNLNAKLQQINSARLNGLVLNVFFGGDVTTRDLGRECWLPWTWTVYLGFDPHANHDSIWFKRKIWVLFQCLSFQVCRKPPKNNQPPWSGWWSSPMKRRTRTWLIYGCPVPAHFFSMDMWIIISYVQLICDYMFMFMYCFMYYDTHTTYPHNIFA